MNTYELLSPTALQEEEFNSRVIKTNGIKEFLLYFAIILQTAIELDFINEEARNSISNLITKAISQDVLDYDEDEFISIPDRQIANYMYVITIYLQHKTNWEALQELNQIRSLEEAKTFIHKARDWMIRMLRRQMIILNSIHSKVAKLGAANITSYYNNLVQVINKFMHFSSLNSDLDLKVNHNVGVSIIGYVFLSNNLRQAHDFYECLCTTINDFRTEISILLKINARSIFKNKKEESEDTYSKQISDLALVNDFYQEKLNDLMKERDKKLEYYYNSLHRPGRKKKDCNDSIKIDQEYDELSANLKIQWDNAINRLKKDQSKSSKLQADLLGGDYYLVDIIKEYAIWSFANKGIMIYPETMEDRGILITNLKLLPAINDFIEMNKDNLDDNEIKYLELCKKSYM